MGIKAELYFEGWIYRVISRVILRGIDLWRDEQIYIERDGIYGQISRVVLTGMGFMEK